MMARILCGIALLSGCAREKSRFPAPPAAEIALIAEGDSLRRLGDSASLGEAMLRYVAAESSAVSRHDSLMRGVHLAAQGAVFSSLLQADSALARYQLAAALFHALRHSNEASAIAAIGRTHARLGAHDSAVAYLERALDVAKSEMEPSANEVEWLSAELARAVLAVNKTAAAQTNNLPPR